MTKYLYAAKYNSEGMKGLIKDGGSKRREAADQAIRSVGGKLESFYFAFGESDVYGVAEFPDDASAAALSATINSSGETTIKLTPLMTVEEMDQASKMSPKYRAPGR